jgi:flagellar biosynthesis/type III secretory pathway M-ring protein FliF/YscJ
MTKRARMTLAALGGLITAVSAALLLLANAPRQPVLISTTPETRQWLAP